MWITPAFAQDGAGGLGGFEGILPLVLIFVVFYFLLIRPQKKQRKEQEARVAALRKGDKVVTIGGMHGIVNAVSKETISIKISEGVFVPFNKVAIASVEKSSKSQGDTGVKVLEEVSKS